MVKGCSVFWDFNYSLWCCLNLSGVGSSNIRVFLRLFSPSLQRFPHSLTSRRHLGTEGSAWSWVGSWSGSWSWSWSWVFPAMCGSCWLVPSPGSVLTSGPCHRHPCLHPSPTSSLSILRSSSSGWGTTGTEVTAISALTCPSAMGPGRQVSGLTKALSWRLVICLSDGSPCLDQLQTYADASTLLHSPPLLGLYPRGGGSRDTWL